MKLRRLPRRKAKSGSRARAAHTDQITMTSAQNNGLATPLLPSRNGSSSGDISRTISLQRELSVTYPSDHPHLADYQSVIVLEPPLRRPFPLCFIFVAIAFIILGSSVPSQFDKAVSNAVWEQTRLDSPLAESFPSFIVQDLSPDADELLLRVFVFHCLNPHDVVYHSAKPLVEERGPFVYAIAIDHLNSSFLSDGDVKELFSVSWQKLKLVLDGPDAGLDDAQLITTVNVPFQIILADAGGLDRILADVIYGPALKRDASQVLFTTRSVRDHLFGYDGAFSSPFDRRSFGKKILEGTHYPGFVQNFSTAEATLKVMGVDALRVDRAMSHVYSYWQGSADVKTCPGCKDGLWNSRRANRVGGSDGKFFANIQNQDRLQVWLPELIRRADLEPRPDLPHTYRDTKVFSLARNTFANATTLPSNAEYFAFDQPDGLLRMSRLLLGVPVFASLPHFLHGSPELVSGIEGLTTPSVNKHDIVFEIHAETGVSIMVAERFQYNILLAPYLRIPELAKVRKVYMPMFWFETLERLSPHHKNLFDRCDNLTQASRVLSTAFMIAGVVCFVVGIGLATLNAEKDAVAKQRHALEVERAAGEFMMPHPYENIEKTGLALMWATPSLARGWLSAGVVAMFMNVFIQTLSLRGQENVEVRTTVAQQIVLTCFIVSFFSAAGGVAVARAAYARGEFPRRRTPFRLVDEPLSCTPRGCISLPLRASSNACYQGLFVGAFAACCFGAPLTLALVLACPDCGIGKYEFVFGKAIMASALMLFFFPLSALRTLATEP